ncbi:hypothetical protein H7Y29_03140 [Microbacteriaceae bacterium]|nr:hypothetical protein [Candidatus Saccharibacteria bacterium]
MKQFLRKNDRVMQWVLGVTVTVVAILVWVSVRLNNSSDVTVYTVFPLLGLVGFSLMWTHYIHGATKRYAALKDHGKDIYWYVSSGIVLACLLLHPLLLSFALWRDGLGLPPFSYMTAYESMSFAIILGSLSLSIFLAFELHRWFSDRSWWRYVDALQFVAMLAIFVHALSLGGELNVVWFKALWWLYGVTLVVAYVYSYRYDRKRGLDESEIK